MKKLAIGVFLVLVVAVGCRNGADQPAPQYPKLFDVLGDVRLSGAENVTGDLDTCRGVGTFADMVPGAPVRIRNSSGDTVATGSIRFSTGTGTFGQRLTECVFRIRIRNVPRGKQYSMVVARQDPKVFYLQDFFATFPIVFDINPPLVTPTTD